MDSYNWFTGGRRTAGDSSDNNDEEYQWDPDAQRRDSFFGRGENDQENDNTFTGNEDYSDLTDSDGNYVYLSDQNHDRHQAQGPNANNANARRSSWFQAFEDEMAEITGTNQQERNLERLDYGRQRSVGVDTVYTNWRNDTESDSEYPVNNRTSLANSHSTQTRNTETSTREVSTNFTYQRAGQQLDYAEQFGLGSTHTQAEREDSTRNSENIERVPEHLNFESISRNDDGLEEVMGRTVNAIENLTRTRAQLHQMHEELRQGFQRGVHIIQHALDTDIPTATDELSRRIAMARLNDFLVSTELGNGTNPPQAGVRPLTQESTESEEFDLWDAHTNMTTFTHNHNIVNNNESDYESEGEVTPPAQNTRIQQQNPHAPDFPRVLNFGFYFGQNARNENGVPPFPTEHVDSRELRRQRAIHRGKVPKHSRNVSPGTSKYFKKFGINAGCEGDGDSSYYDNPYKDIDVIIPMVAYEKDLLEDKTPFSLFDEPNTYVEESDAESNQDEDDEDTLVHEENDKDGGEVNGDDTDEDAEELNEEEQVIRNEMMHEWSLDDVDNTPYPPRIELDDNDLMLERFLRNAKTTQVSKSDFDKMRKVKDKGDGINELDDQNSKSKEIEDGDDSQVKPSA